MFKKILFRDVLCITFFLAVMAALFMPVFIECGKSTRWLTLSNMKRMSVGLFMYTSDFNDKFPTYATRTVQDPHLPPVWDDRASYASEDKDWTTAIFPYVKDASLYRSPLDTSKPPKDPNHPSISNGEYKTSFTLNAWAAYGFKTAEAKNPGSWVTLGIRNNNSKLPTRAWIFHWWLWGEQSANTWPQPFTPSIDREAALELYRNADNKRDQDYELFAFGDGHAKHIKLRSLWLSQKQNYFWPYSE